MRRKASCSSIEGEKYLPQEIIIEILSWLPVNSAIKFKCVCKSWLTILEDPKFIKQHMHRSKPEIVYEDESKSNVNEEIFDAFHGLVLEKSKKTKKFRIRNPATRQVLEVPYDTEEQVDYENMFLCFDSFISSYKLLCVHLKIGIPTECVVKMLTIGTDLAWRPLHISILYNHKEALEHIIMSNNVTYFISIYKAELKKLEIIRLNLDDESFMTIKIPWEFQSGGDQFQNFIWDNNMSIGFIIKEELHVWVLENYKKHIWSVKKIIPLDFMKDLDTSNNNDLVVTEASGSLLQISLNSSSYLIYDITSKKYEYEADLGKMLYTIVPSLVSLPGMHSSPNSLTAEANL